ncbi:MAG: exopolysaccharide transport family protein [Mesorhizobium sp.]|nr:exopolysaccharide transport family protein [Mesorhizobium sp.]
MTGSGIKGSDVDVDLGTLFASIIRDWRLILAVALGITALAFVLAWLATPHFRAETRILIETRESVFTRPNPAGEADKPILDEEGVTSQVEVISSTDLLKQVAAKLNLGKLPEFDEAAGMSLIGRVMVLAGLKSDPSELAAEERVLKTMREKLRVYRVERSRVIVIEFSSENPKLAADVPNAIADAYLAVQRAAKLQSNADATEWLEPEIADLRERVKAAETRVADFRSQSDLLIGQNNSVLATQQLSEMSTELSRVRAGRASAEANAQSLRAALANGASLEAMPEVLSSPLIQRLRERQVQLKADIADLSTTLLDNHPRIKALRSQLADLDRQIAGEAMKVLKGLETEAATARLREEKLVVNLNAVKAESSRVGDEEVELRALEREAASQRDLLESYLTRYREAASRRDRSYLPADARIFSRATQPSEPYFPKVVPIVAAAFVASLLLMAMVTLLRELFSGRAMRAADDGRYFEPVGRVEMPEPATPASVAPEPAPPLLARRAPNDNRLSVQGAAERIIAGGASRAIFISPEGDEGAASAVLVAREVADSGLRVMLLDLTSSGAASLPMLDGEVLPGITNLLASEAQFADVIHADRYSDCHVIPVGTANAARAMRAADRLPIILESLATAYDVVVVECGPADAEGIRRLVADGTQVLVSALELTDQSIAETTRDLTDGGYSSLLMVKPEGDMTPTEPMPDRNAA